MSSEPFTKACCRASLSLAQTDLRIGKDGSYEPAKRERDIVVRVGRDLPAQRLRQAQGDRLLLHPRASPSSTCSITRWRPALDDHLARLEALGDRAASDDFFDFRVADIAMGSGHFLVAAIDRIEKRFSTLAGGQSHSRCHQ